MIKQRHCLWIGTLADPPACTGGAGRRASSSYSVNVPICFPECWKGEFIAMICSNGQKLIKCSFAEFHLIGHSRDTELKEGRGELAAVESAGCRCSHRSPMSCPPQIPSDLPTPSFLFAQYHHSKDSSTLQLKRGDKQHGSISVFAVGQASMQEAETVEMKTSPCYNHWAAFLKEALNI